MKIIKRIRNARRWDALGLAVKPSRLNSDASNHQQVPVAHQLTRPAQVVRRTPTR